MRIRQIAWCGVRARVLVGLAALLAPVLPARGQASESVRAVPLTIEAYTARIMAWHPTVRQARLGAETASEEVRIARGAFDPYVSLAWDRKTFGSTEYYDYVTAQLSVPTPLGADFKIGYEATTGQYISPDRRTPGGGLLIAGLSIPLGQRIVTDERRTAIAVARAVRDGADADRQAALNRTLVTATRDYAKWYESDRRAVVAREGVVLADFRLRAVRQRVTNGEGVPLDTVEALLETDRRRVQAVEAEQALYAARLMAEAHLWDARGLPDTLPTGATPVAGTAPYIPSDSASVARLVAAAQREHPDVLRAESRVESAEAQRRLVSQQRIPFVAAELGALRDAGDGFPASSVSANDLKVGVTARSPLLYVRERARFSAASLRLEQQEVDRAKVLRDLAVTVRVAAAEVDAASRAAALQRSAIGRARELLRGESLRFEVGEGTLFLVNARERAVLEEEVRLAAIEARALVARGDLTAVVGGWREPGR